MIGTRWARNFTVSSDDIEYVLNVLLEKETPMTTRELARLLVERHLQAEQDALVKQYSDTKIYRPANQYTIGERLIFTQMELATATVTAIRPGQNDAHGPFDVLSVQFDDDEHNLPDKPREFAASLHSNHQLNDQADDNPLTSGITIDPDELLDIENNIILRVTFDALKTHPTLERVAGYWFPRELVLEFDIGMMHLAEAVLDMAGGGPMTPEEIIKQIGGIGESPMQLQVFSINVALNQDGRFDEVGPAGKVLWYLNRMEPEYVRQVPDLLKYTPIEFDDDLLSDDMFDLETELDDELTSIEFEGNLPKATTTLIYPHRRAGTLPLNAKNRKIFPVARTPRIHVQLVDASDGETYTGWVVHEHRYVYGLLDYYTKHRLPVGVFLSAEAGEKPGQILISHDDYKPRTEWIRIVTPSAKKLAFESKKRAIGASYDELIIIGVDDLDAVDALAISYKNKPLATILRDVIDGLSKLSPQGTVHLLTIYSAANVLRRCAPGPIFATLSANRDFEDVGDHYWKLRETD